MIARRAHDLFPIPIRLNPQQEAVVRFFNQLGWALFGVSIVVSCFEFGIEYSSGRGNIRQTALNCFIRSRRASLCPF